MANIDHSSFIPNFGFTSRSFSLIEWSRKNGLYDMQCLINEIKMNTIKRVPVTISLLDEAGAPTMVWTLANAWPTKITGTDLKSDGNEVAIETIEIVHEGITIDNA